ncbi:hypothetical protein GDO86_001337 [Hymenochirus boettgeri]|uniref:Uncharacterized protein n=1 Tax=Hymenochirus boettgeri TaxID=247094 RepID=A0A8T2KGP1_9PIPI|nr:hypothetical protein GDO86_001337 [Hymenochirus boettgeri]
MAEAGLHRAQCARYREGFVPPPPLTALTMPRIPPPSVTLITRGEELGRGGRQREPWGICRHVWDSALCSLRPLCVCLALYPLLWCEELEGLGRMRAEVAHRHTHT